jgi:hypothetical protein
MLRAAGLNAYAMKVVDRDSGVFDPSFLSLEQLDDTLVVLDTGGKEILLDPGEKMCPFQTIHWRHSSAGGIMQAVKSRTLALSPKQAYAENKTVRSGDVTLDAQGALTGTFRFVMTGQQALYWRQMALRFDLNEVKKQFDHSIESLFPESVEAHVRLFTGLDNPDQDLSAIVNAKGNLGAATSRRMILPAFFFETRGRQPFVAQEKRTQPVDMRYGEFVADQVTYHLPDGFIVEGAPQDVNISWSNHAMLINQSASAPGQITIVRSLTRAFTFAKPDEYQDLRGFYQKVAAADQQQLVLTKSPAAPAPASKSN